MGQVLTVNLGQVARILAGFAIFYSLMQAVPLALALQEEPAEGIDAVSGFLGSMAVGLLSSVLLWFGGRKPEQGFFRVLVGGDTLPHRKPHPLPVRHALASLCAEPNWSTMVGDSENDLRAGKAAGTRTVAVLHGYGAEATLRAEGADEYWRTFGVSC